MWQELCRRPLRIPPMYTYSQPSFGYGATTMAFGRKEGSGSGFGSEQQLNVLEERTSPVFPSSLATNRSRRLSA